MKTLTIEHIAPYISHGLKVYSIPQNGEYFIERLTGIRAGITGALLIVEGEEVEPENFSDYKPILVPIDKLTDRQYAEVGRALMTDRCDWAEKQLIASGKSWIKFLNHNAYGMGSALRAIQYLHSIFADVHNLIPAGLAISAHDLPENPYQESAPCEHQNVRPGHSPYVACICDDCGQEV